MDHRERVLCAINHEEPDLVPMLLWGSAYGVTDDLYFTLVDEFRLGTPLLPFRRLKGHAVNYYDDRVLEQFDIDVRVVDSGFSDLGGPASLGGKDAWGIHFDGGNHANEDLDHPLQDADDEAIAAYNWPVPYQLMRIDELSESGRKIKENTDYALMARSLDSFGFFKRCCLLRGTDTFLTDLSQREEVADLLIKKVADVLLKGTEIYLTEVGKYLDIIELPTDEYANTRPLISPRTFDRYFAPYWKKMIDMIHEASPGCKVLFHSNGNIEPFVSRLVTLGIDVLHGLDPSLGNDLKQMKKDYGNTLCFSGGFCPMDLVEMNSDALSGKVHDLINLMATDGGYLFSPARHFGNQVKPDLIADFYRFGRWHGRYPLE